MSLELYINIFENNYNTSLLNYLQNLENRQDYYDLIEYLKINMSTTIKQQIVIDVSSLTDTIESSDLSIYYKKTWTKLNNIHKILKLKEFVNNSILNNSKKNELIILLIDLVKNKTITKKNLTLFLFIAKIISLF